MNNPKKNAPVSNYQEMKTHMLEKIKKFMLINCTKTQIMLKETKNVITWKINRQKTQNTSW